MPELRQDPVTKRWTVIATERAKRPDDFAKRPSGKAPVICPFEYGNEAMTPPEVLAFRPTGIVADSPGWTVRVVPNKFPAFSFGHLSETVDGLYRSMVAQGAHEVIIHGPNHVLSLATYPESQTVEVIRAYKMRYQYYKKQEFIRYVQIIINHGEAAGASLEHSHSQLFALPVVPPKPHAELIGSADYHNSHSRCIYCDIIASEIDKKIRVVEQTDNFIALVPYAASLPFETWVTPVDHRATFETLSDDEQNEFAALLRRTLRRFFFGLDDPPYNAFLHTSPPGYLSLASYHWHMVIIPRLTLAAGFELGTDMCINITIPEQSAQFLKDVSI
ncbi:MAG TPA: galactose-1-phosphate uridylyltransferase [Candidatus Aquicultor sp.]|jgi:UDPglucose--hexose-1-phosphate uridylyltransferase